MTYNKQIRAMDEHPVKTFLSVIAGLIAGSHSLLNSSVSFLCSINPKAIIDLSVACGKAFMVGGSAWLGQTALIYFRKSVIRWWKNRKEKKNARNPD